MDSASKAPTPGLRQKLIIVAAIAVTALLATLGLSTLQQRTASEVQARKNPTALAFEKAPEQWLAHPREASEFERALRAKEVAAVGVSGSLVLYTDRAGHAFSTRLIDCGLGCKNEIGSRLGELSVAQGFALTDVDVDARTAGQRLSQSLERAGGALAPILVLLLVDNPNDGTLYRIDLDPAAANSRTVTPIAGAAVRQSYGMVLDGHRLVVADFHGLSIVELSDDASRGTVVGQSREPSFRETRAVAHAGDRYLVVNSKAEKGQSYTVVSVPTAG